MNPVLFSLFFSLALLITFTKVGNVRADTLTQANQYYLDASYEEAIELILNPESSNQDLQHERLLGLCYFETLQYDLAKPLLSAAFENNNKDVPVVFAVSQVLLSERKYQKSLNLLNGIEVTDNQDKAKKYHLMGRLYLGLNNQADAVENFKDSNNADESFELKNAIYLAAAYQAMGKEQKSLSLIEKNIRDNPKHFEIARLRYLKDKINNRYNAVLSATLSTRSEYDTNAVLKPKDNSVVLDVAGKSDKRQTFSGDLQYHKPVSRTTQIIAEAHFYHSIHEDLNTFDTSLLNVGLSSVWRKSRWDFRTPIEATGFFKDGNQFSSHFSVSPGLSYSGSSRWLLHSFFRYQQNKFEDNTDQAEDKNGAYTGLGVFLSLPTFNKASSLRAVLEYGNVSTEGKNWERSEFSGIIKSELAWRKLRFDIGLQVLIQDFANLNSTTLEKREDTGYWITSSIAYEVFNHWEVFVSGTLESHSSTISFYEYDRSVIAAGISWTL